MASGIATKRQDKELTSLLITRCYKKTGTRWRFPEVNFSDPDVNINSCLHNRNEALTYWQWIAGTSGISFH